MGLTPQVKMAKVQITVSVNPGFHAILLGIFKNANYFHVIANATRAESGSLLFFFSSLKAYGFCVCTILFMILRTRLFALYSRFCEEAVICTFVYYVS